MNKPALLPSLVFLVTWSYTEGIVLGTFFVEQSETFNYRANKQCLNVPKPSRWRIANQMMELMKNLEGEDSLLISNVSSNLIRSGFTSRNMQIEPEREQTKAMQRREYDSYPKIAGLVWLAVTDPVGVKMSGWCSVKKINTFLSISRPAEVTKKLQSLEQSISQDIRLILENFIKSIVWPSNTHVKSPFLELTKYYKSTTKRPTTLASTTRTLVDDADKSPIARSIMHLEADSEDSDEESTEVIKIPIMTPTPTGGRTLPVTLTFRTHQVPTTPTLRTMIIHTSTSPPPTTPARKDVTIKSLLIAEGDDEGDSDAEIDIMTKSPYVTKSSPTFDDGFFLDDDFGARKSTRTDIIEHIPVTYEIPSTFETEAPTTPSPEPTTTAQTEVETEPIAYVPQPTLLPEDDSKESESNSISDSNESKSASQNEDLSVDSSTTNTVEVVVSPAPTQPETTTEQEIDLDSKQPTVGIAVTVTYRAFTEDDTHEFMKLVSVDEGAMKTVSENRERELHRDDYENSNVKEYPIVLLIIFCNAILL